MKWTHKKFVLNGPIKVDYISGCCWLIKKEILKKTSGFERKYFIYNEEVEWAYRIKNLGYSIYLIPSSKIYHLGHATTGKISGFQLYHQIRNTIWFEKKYAGPKFLIFLVYLLLYKMPKMILKNLSSGDALKKNRAYLKGVIEGLFT